jgi:hypothetical protein
MGNFFKNLGQPNIEFEGKTFHLSGNFTDSNKKNQTKEIYAKKINSLGGFCRGYGNNKGLKLSNTNYFVIGFYKNESDGKKESQVNEWNEKHKDKLIQKLKQKDLDEIIENKNNIPPPFNP